MQCRGQSHCCKSTLKGPCGRAASHHLCIQVHFVLFWFSETGSYYAAQAGLKLLVPRVVLQPLEWLAMQARATTPAQLTYILKSHTPKWVRITSKIGEDFSILFSSLYKNRKGQLNWQESSTRMLHAPDSATRYKDDVPPLKSPAPKTQLTPPEVRLQGYNHNFDSVNRAPRSSVRTSTKWWHISAKLQVLKVWILQYVGGSLKIKWEYIEIF